MPRLRVSDKTALGNLVVSAAVDPGLREKLVADPHTMLRTLVEELPPGHKIKVVTEDDNTTVLVIPSADSLPKGPGEIEQILREEARQYDEARRRVDGSKGKAGPDGKKPIPDDVLRETYALMIGNTALSPTSRPRGRGAARAA